MSAYLTPARRESVRRFLAAHPGATTREVRDGAGVGEETARAILGALVDCGLATYHRVGMTKHYTLTEGEV